MVFGLFLTLVGGFFFGPWGALAGSLLASALFPPKTPKSQLENVRVQSSAYGQTIYEFEGTVRLGMNIIWPKDFVLQNETVTITLGIDFLFIKAPRQTINYRRGTWLGLFGEGPADTIKVIWMNGKIWYDARTDAEGGSNQSRTDSQAMLTATQNGLRFMLGEPDQDQNEYMLTVQDASELPAYRNRVCILFLDWDLRPFGDNVPLVNALVVKKGETVPDGWQIVSGTLTVNNEGRSYHSSTVAYDGTQLWIVGGAIYDGDWGQSTATVVRATIDPDTDDLTWESLQSIPQTRESMGVVFLPGLLPGSDARVLVMGGWDVNAYFDTQDMVLEHRGGSEDSWTEVPIISDEGGYTLSRKPFPRYAFAVAYLPFTLQNINAKYMHTVWVHGGRTDGNGSGTGNDYPTDWDDGSGRLRDLWMFNGVTWQLMTAIDGGESADAGMGYRTDHSMVYFKDTMWSGGGLKYLPGDVKVLSRDVYKLLLYPSDDVTPYFALANSDILSSIDFGYKSDLMITDFVVWRDQLIAFVTDDTTLQEPYLFRSDDGTNWEYHASVSFSIVSNTATEYVVSGDQRKSVSTDSTITVVNDTDRARHLVTAIVYDSGTDQTTLTVTSSPDSTLSSGTIYVDQLSMYGLSSNHNIVSVDTSGSPNDYFAISGDYTDLFTSGATFTVAASTGNDGNYTVIDSAFISPNTRVYVSTVSDPNADGYIHISRDQYRMNIISSATETNMFTVDNLQGRMVVVGGRPSWGSTVRIFQSNSSYVRTDNTLLGDVVSNICKKAGLKEEQIDVSELMGKRSWIVSANTTSDYFEIEGNHTARFYTGIQFMVKGSSGNDGTYTVTSSATFVDPNTRIPVASVPSDTDDGVLFEIGSEIIEGVVFERSAAKDRIEILRQYGFFDAVERDGKVYFPMRSGKSVSHTLTQNDLAAHYVDDGEGYVDGDSLPEELTIEREEEKSPPQIVEIRYYDSDRSYEEGFQLAKRPEGVPQKRETLDLPIVMNADKASQIVHVLLWDANTDKVTFSVNPEFLDMIPTDLVTITTATESYTVRIDKIDYEGALLKVEGSVENTALYDTPQIGASIPVVEEYGDNLGVITTSGLLLDIHIISSDHDDFGFYFVAYPDPDDDRWKGATIYVMDGSTPVPLADVFRAVTYGVTTDELGSIPDTGAWDRVNIVIVDFTNGYMVNAPASETEADILLKGSNLALLGNEIINFANVTSLGSNQYRLDTLLRGQYGTEDQVTEHAVGDQFILLEVEALGRCPMTENGVGKEFSYKLVPTGQNPTYHTSTITFTNTMLGKKPYSVAGLSGFRTSDNTWEITFFGRSRAREVGFIASPGDRAIRYDVEILDESQEVVNTYQITDQGVVVPQQLKFNYTEAMQTIDFGSTQSTIRINVYQVSSEYGRGYVANGTFTV